MLRSSGRILLDVKRRFGKRFPFFFENELFTWGKGAEEIKNKSMCEDFPVVLRLGIHLPMQGTWV